MSERHEFTCDTCGADLTRTSNVEGWRVVLGSQAVARMGGVVTAMHVPPPVEGPKHFCDLPCLARWIDPLMPDLLKAYGAKIASLYTDK